MSSFSLDEPARENFKQALKLDKALQLDPNEFPPRVVRVFEAARDLLLKESGWALDQARDRESPVTGMATKDGSGFVDYVLWGDDGKPLALVEAKRTRRDSRVGQQQAWHYAECLEKQFGQRPIIFYSNGYEHWIWDDVSYPPRGAGLLQEIGAGAARPAARQPQAARRRGDRRRHRRALLPDARHPEDRSRRCCASPTFQSSLRLATSLCLQVVTPPLIFLGRAELLICCNLLGERIVVPAPVASEIMERGQEDVTARAIRATLFSAAVP